jgi:hypothetical protein
MWQIEIPKNRRVALRLVLMHRSDKELLDKGNETFELC